MKILVTPRLLRSASQAERGIKLKMQIANPQQSDENIGLQEATIANLIATNKRWQRYNVSMEEYLSKLLSTIRDQQEQIDRLTEIISPMAQKFRNDEPFDTCESFYCQISNLNRKTEMLKRELISQHNKFEKIVKENCQINTQKIHLEIRLRDAIEHIEHLNRKVSILESSKMRCHNIYHSEQELHRHLSSNEEIMKNLAENFNLECDSVNVLPPPSKELTCGASNFNICEPPVIEQTRSLGVVNSIIDSFKNKKEPMIETELHFDNICPNCYTVFPVNYNLDFLEHIEKCEKPSDETED